MVQLITLSKDDLKIIIKESVSQVLDERKPHQETTENQINYLTRKQVSEKLHLSLTTLDTYTKLGILTAVKVGHRVLYRSDDLNDTLSEKIESIKHKIK